MSSTKPPRALEQEMAALRAEFAGKLPTLVERMSTLIATARARPESLAEAIRAAHNMRGNAGTLGFHAVGESAGRVEDGLRAFEAAGPERTDAAETAWEAVEGALDDVRASAFYVEVPKLPQAFVGTPEKVLWVDEDGDFLETVRQIAREEWIEVIPATDIASALEVARTTEIGGAVIDQQMRGGAASSLARQLRSLPGREELAIAMASVDDGLESRVASTLTGARVFLSKTDEPPALLDGLRQLLRARDGTRPRILVVDDDPEFAGQASAILRDQGWIAIVEDGPAQILETLEAVQPDLVLLDMVMPRFSGIEICRSIRASGPWHALPVVFLTAQQDAGTRLAAFEAGGDDYVTKPVLPEELAARIRVRLDRARLLRERSDRDSLSGLLLRRPFLEALRSQLAYAERQEQPLTLCLLNVDDLKGLNDRHGRLAGDEALRQLAGLLRQRFRAEDIRCRWGGQEFLVAFLGESPEVVEMVMTRLLVEYSERDLVDDDGVRFRASFTAGIASFPRDGHDLRSLIRIAERRRARGRQECGGIVVRRDRS